MHIAKIARADVVDLLRRVAARSTSEARKARRVAGAVLELAVAREWCAENVARAGNGIDAALPALKGRAAEKHHAAMPPAAAGGFLKKLLDMRSTAGDALAFIMLTAVRSNEARGAEWTEIDAERRVWTVPESRMKTGGEHRVPLSDAAIDILRGRRGLHPRYVFASDRTRRPVSGEGVGALARRAETTVHGFRSTFRDWAGEAGQPREVAEAALAHAVGDATERAYARSDLLDRRRELMDAWADYLRT